MGKTVLVTGATSGFGEAIARKFAENGNDLIITGRREDRLHRLQEEWERQYSIKVQPLCFDIRDKAAVQEVLALFQNETIDILVNNAGLAAGMAAIDEGDTEDWDIMIDTNVKGLLYMTKAVLPLLKRSATPHIFNIGSTAGKMAYKNGNVYCATKHAVDALNQSMRIDLLPYGIKVTAINPGMAETEFSVVRFKGNNERAKKVYDDIQPLVASDIADTVWYCANLPAHVCINDLTITCTGQANAMYLVRDSERVKSTLT
ncbi:MAG TPA: SDR family NAD(P)-dependent oxidoreductase [Flavipsychrobacter sp.]|nr:SDR family NAD(P)-dependent oxidoreductase [Flavipsychrobacter sp.]